MSPYLGSALDARAQQLQAVCAVVARVLGVRPSDVAKTIAKVRRENR